MVKAYWQIGRIIVEHEQNGSLRSEYGKAVLQSLSERLTEEFGKGFTVTNLKIYASVLCDFSKWSRTAWRIDMDALTKQGKKLLDDDFYDWDRDHDDTFDRDLS